MTNALPAYPAPIASEMLIRGVLLAFACTAVQMALLFVTQWAGMGIPIALVVPPMLAFAHGFFIITLTDWGLRHAARDEDQAMFAPWPVTLAGTLFIGLALLGIGFAATIGMGSTAAPPLGLIGWTLLVVTAFPARIAATMRGQRLVFKPLARRLPVLLLACAPVWALGYLFDHAPGGFMDGAMVVLPFFLLFLFAASLFAALLPALAISPQAEPAQNR